jgi:hypothetical protein
VRTMNGPWAIGSDETGGRRRALLFLWATAAVAWVFLVGWSLCDRIDSQVAASQEIAREIAALDCDRPASCTAAARSAGGYGGTWGETATLFVTYGFWPLVTVAFAPPGILLGIGVLTAWMLRRLRRPQPAAALAVMPLRATRFTTVPRIKAGI